jgi:hypothetical protein
VRTFGTIYRYWVALVFAAIIAQIAGAAYGAFYSAQKLGDQNGPDEQKLISEKAFDHGFAFHTAFGYIIFLGAVILVLVALAARLGKRRVLLALAVPLLVAVQIVLAWASEAVHGVGPLHGINALVLFGFTGFLSREAWRQSKLPTAEPQPTARGIA